MRGHGSESLVASFRALTACSRSWLGPTGPSFKCVLDGDDPKASVLVGDVRAYLLAADTDPTATSLLLEALEGVVRACEWTEGGGLRVLLPGPCIQMAWPGLGRTRTHPLSHIRSMPQAAVTPGPPTRPLFPNRSVPPVAVTPGLPVLRGYCWSACTAWSGRASRCQRYWPACTRLWGHARRCAMFGAVATWGGS